VNDPILKVRLEMLGENLRAAIRVRDYLAEDMTFLALDRAAVAEVNDAFDHHTQQQAERLEKAIKALDTINDTDTDGVRSAWNGYAALSENNSRIYREFLEAMLGLAIRRKSIDESDRICKIADVLIENMKSYGANGKRLAIPASHEAYSRTLARLVRMRFPEWTIWSLSLVAHEFGHVVIEDNPDLANFVKSESEALAEKDPEYVPGTSDPAEKRRNERILRREFCRLRQLMADAFAVHRIGPSYVCSLVLLRLSPLESESDGGLRDAERAVVSIQVLREMSKADPQPPAYEEIVKHLENEWNGMMQRSGVTPLPQAAVDALCELAKILKNTLDDQLAGTAYKLYLPAGGWNVAYGWYANWKQESKIAANKLSIPEGITGAGKIYDVLNAAWAYRLFANPVSLEPVSNIARATCEAIMSKQETDTRGGGGKAPAVGG